MLFFGLFSLKEEPSASIIVICPGSCGKLAVRERSAAWLQFLATASACRSLVEELETREEHPGALSLLPS